MFDSIEFTFMAAPTTTNEVTVRRLSEVLVGSDGAGGIKKAVNDKIAAAINALDVTSTGGAGKYISAISETNGKISATATSMDTTPTASSTNAVTSGGIKSALDGKAASSHTHGNITNGGALQTNDITIADGDKLVVTDSSDSNKIARTSVSFDGSTTTKALTQKGTFESFAKASDITSAIQALDVSSVGGAGKYISAISETDGKISATATSMDTTPTASSTNAVTSGGIKTALDLKAPLASPALTGTPTAPTASTGTNTTQIATTEFVTGAVSNYIKKNELFYLSDWTFSPSRFKIPPLSQLSEGFYCLRKRGYVITATLTNGSTTTTWGDDAIDYMFDGTYEHITPMFGDGYTLTINIAPPSGQSSLNIGYGMTGNIVVGFYHVYAPTSVSCRIYAAASASATKTWKELSPTVVPNSGNNVQCWVFNNPYYYNNQLEITIVGKTQSDSVKTSVPVLQFITSRPTANSYPYVRKYKPETLYNSLTAPKFIGALQGNADTATKLATTRELAVNLANTSTTSNFDGSASQTGIKVSGTLPVANGGTGQTSLANVTVGTATKATQDSDGNAINATYFKSSGSVTLVSGAATKIGTSNGADVKLTLPTIPAAANNGALNIGINGETATSKFTANQSTDSTLTFAEGATDGTIAVDGTDVAVHGLGSAAYTASTDYATSNHTHSVTINGETKTIPASGDTAVDLGTYPKYVNGFAPATTGTFAGKIIAYGVCATGPSTQTKNVYITAGSFNFWPGARVIVNFEHGNTAAKPKLSIDGGTAYPIYFPADSGWLPEDLKGSVLLFLYNDGVQSYWEIMAKTRGRSNANSGTGYATCDTAEATTAKVGTLSNYMLRTGGIVAVKFTYAVPASATLNINSAGAKAIYYRDAAITAGVIGAGDTVTFMYDGTYYCVLSVMSSRRDSIVPVVSKSASNSNQKTASTYAFDLDAYLGIPFLIEFKFPHEGAAATLNINDTGDKTLCVNGSATSAYNRFPAGVYWCVYDGTQYNLDVPEHLSDRVMPTSVQHAVVASAIDVGSAIGSSTTGVYIDSTGRPVACDYSVNKTVPANAVFTDTDTKVKATAKTDNVNYKILATASASPTSGNATEAVYDTDITLNPSTNTISASISGNAATATSAGKLTTARKTYVTLGTASTTTTRDWSGDTTIPVSGTLAIANGGTGASDASGARTNLSVYSKSEVDSMLGGRIEIVASLPSTGESGVIYYVGPTGSGGDQYDEYIWSGSAFIKVGEHSIDLSNYVNTLTAAGSGSVVTGLSKSGNTLTWTKGNISLDNLSTWASTSDVTVSSKSYHTYWPIAPTSSNQVYGVSITDGKLYQIYNNKGTYSVRSYDQDNNTTYTNEKLGQGYGTCTTEAATAAKVASLTDYVLVKGGIVAVKFTEGLCASATLNVNGKGAKTIYIHGAAATATTAKEVKALDVAYFMYDGTYYQFLGTDRVFKEAITGLSISGKTITYTKADGSTGTLTTQDTTYEFDGTYNASTNKAATVSTVTSKINALDVSDISGFGAGKTLATLTETDGKIAATFQNISITKSQVSDFPTSMTPTSHASSATTYGIGTTANYGHVKLATGDMNGATHADGVAVSKNHTHSQYQTVLTEMTTQEVDDLLAVLT